MPPKEEEKETEKDDQEKVSSKNTSSGAGSASEIASKLGIFRRDCETFINEQLEARLVMLTADGTHEEIVNTVTSSRLYNNLANSGSRLMGFYDVKNATLCDIYEGEALTQREPALDEDKFKAFLNIYNSIMKVNGDVCWIMAGRCDSNLEIIKKAIALYNWKFKVFSLVYDSKLLQKWYWRRMRGLANSKNLERLLFCWKGRLPTNLPKHRHYLDAGSPLYCEVMLKAPVVAPKDLAFVAKEVRRQSRNHDWYFSEHGGGSRRPGGCFSCRGSHGDGGCLSFHRRGYSSAPPAREKAEALQAGDRNRSGLVPSRQFAARAEGVAARVGGRRRTTPLGASRYACFFFRSPGAAGDGGQRRRPLRGHPSFE